MSDLGTEMAFEVLAEVHRLKALGHEIINFGIGEPDFPTPENIKAAGIRAIENDRTHYTPSAGLQECREAIARYIKREKGAEVNPERIVVTPGAKPIIFFGIMAGVNPGEEVIYPNPGYPIYESMIHYAGAEAVPLPLLESKDFSFDVDDLKGLVNDRTAMVILNSPSNPTGGVLSREDFREVASLAVKHDFWVLSDEIYSRLTYDKEFVSAMELEEMRDKLILMDGHSKIYAMTGWRLGWGAMNEEMAWAVARLMTNSAACTTTFVQLAGIEAYDGSQEGAKAMVREFQERRDLIVDLLNDIEGVSCIKPPGAFYAFPNVTEACRRRGVENAEEFQQRLLAEAEVAVLARTCFGPRNRGEDQEYVRLSYATSKEKIEEGLERMKRWVEGG